MPGRTIWTVARSCSELTLSEVKKDKHYFIGWGSWLFQIWLKMRKPLNCGEKPMQGLPEAQFKLVTTGNSDVLGINGSRKAITDATWISERSIFAAAQISLMLTHLQPEHEKTMSQESHWARSPTEHLCRHKCTSCSSESTAASHSLLWIKQKGRATALRYKQSRDLVPKDKQRERWES